MASSSTRVSCTDSFENFDEDAEVAIGFCASCRGGVTRKEQHLNVFGNRYHMQHFNVRYDCAKCVPGRVVSPRDFAYLTTGQCGNCKVNIGNNPFYEKPAGSPLCQGCYSRHHQTNCTKCRKRMLPRSQHLAAPYSPTQRLPSASVSVSTTSSTTRSASLAPPATSRLVSTVRVRRGEECALTVAYRGARRPACVREALHRALHSALLRLFAADHRPHPHRDGRRASPDLLQGPCIQHCRFISLLTPRASALCARRRSRPSRSSTTAACPCAQSATRDTDGKLAADHLQAAGASARSRP